MRFKVSGEHQGGDLPVDTKDGDTVGVFMIVRGVLPAREIVA